MRAIGRICPVATSIAIAAFGLWHAPAAAAEPPGITSVYVEEGKAMSADLHGEVNPKGIPTFIRFEYLTEAAYLANAFAGASWAPLSGSLFVGSGVTSVRVGELTLKV